MLTDKGQPRDIVKSIKPVWNNFVFFEVNLVSFHQVITEYCDGLVSLLPCQQVSEILCTGKTRLSINGWFHGVPVSRPAPHHEAPLQFWSPMPMEVRVQRTPCSGNFLKVEENHSQIFWKLFLQESHLG